jgi:lipid-binding SYLF domain-containing protein
MSRQISTGVILTVIMGLTVGGCNTAPDSEASRETIETQVEQAVSAFKVADPGIATFFQDAYGYAVLPKVVKGAFIVGGGHGQGHVYEQGKLIGYCSLSLASIGASIGGETFREIIFFENADALKRFCVGEFKFSAQVTAVAVSTGAALKAKYNNGMVVFMMTDKGLMADASAGGQTFNYVSKDDAEKQIQAP